jgi:hypothetical protein
MLVSVASALLLAVAVRVAPHMPLLAAADPLKPADFGTFYSDFYAPGHAEPLDQLAHAAIFVLTAAVMCSDERLFACWTAPLAIGGLLTRPLQCVGAPWLELALVFALSVLLERRLGGSGRRIASLLAL